MNNTKDSNNKDKWSISIAGLSEEEYRVFFKDYPTPNSIVYKKGALMESCVELVSNLPEEILAGIIANILYNHYEEIWDRIKISIQVLGESYFNISKKNLEILYQTILRNKANNNSFIDVYEHAKDKYNKEFGTSISLDDSQRLFTLPYISPDEEILTVDKKLTIYAVLYVFGTPSLFQQYRLFYALLESHLYKEANSVLNSFNNEYKQHKAQVEDLIKRNPEWIVHLINFVLNHELSHLYLHDNQESKEEMISYYKQRVLDYHVENIEESIQNMYDIEKRRIAQDDTILEEYTADALAYSQLASFINQKTNDYGVAVICAICMTSIYFLEYASRIERLYSVLHIEYKNIRMIKNMRREWSGSVEQRMRVLLMDQKVLELLHEHPISDKAYELYNVLVETIVATFNENTNTQLCLSLEPYYQALINGEISLNAKNKDKLVKYISKFNQNIIELLNTALQEKGSMFRFAL